MKNQSQPQSDNQLLKDMKNDNICEMCGENFATHNDDGSCIEDENFVPYFEFNEADNKNDWSLSLRVTDEDSEFIASFNNRSDAMNMCESLSNAVSKFNYPALVQRVQKTDEALSVIAEVIKGDEFLKSNLSDHEIATIYNSISSVYSPYSLPSHPLVQRVKELESALQRAHQPIIEWMNSDKVETAKERNKAALYLIQQVRATLSCAINKDTNQVLNESKS